MTPTKPHIDVLIEQCKSGQQHAQMEVYNRYYKAMYNTSFRIVKDNFKAEDIMQESFLTAFTKLHTLKETSMFGPWLKRIVINNSISEYHKMQKKREVPLDDMLYKVENNQDIVEDYEWTNLKAGQIIQCMEDLKDTYRIGLTLYLIEGYDYEDLCEIMNINYASCRTMISRAKDSLRQKLKLVNTF